MLELKRVDREGTFVCKAHPTVTVFFGDCMLGFLP